MKEEEERERLRKKRIAEEEAQQLLARLKIIEEEEAERKKKKQLEELEAKAELDKARRLREAEMHAERMRLGQTYTIETIETENTLTQEEDILGISEEELDRQCDDLFAETPIKFKPKKNDTMDAMISMFIKELGINIPIVWIKGSLYLIGSQRLNCEVKGDQLIIRVGGGYQTF